MNPAFAQKATLTEICSVRLGNALFGVPIRHILEIVGSVHPQPVPLSANYLGGLVHYRGDVLTAISLHQLLAMPRIADLQDMLVLECPGSCFGLLVDSVGKVLTISSADCEPNPSTLDERHKTFFAGACKLQEGLMVLLDPKRLDPMRLANSRDALSGTI